MDFAGKWAFHSIETFGDEGGMVYMNAEEYLRAPMPYVDTEDEEAVADEMKERRQMVGSALEICEDGFVQATDGSRFVTVVSTRYTKEQ